MRCEEREPYGSPNPNAPKELDQFAFLIGKWPREGVSKNEQGIKCPYQMTWLGRYILDGHAIADEARIFDEENELQAIFITYRYYDRDGERWLIEALNVLESKMIYQAPDDLGGVRVNREAITLETRWPNAISRESYLNRTKDHFTYRLEVSTDEGKTWREGVDLIDATRIREEIHRSRPSANLFHANHGIPQ